MINNVFYVILVFSFFLLIIKCEYIKNEKKEVVFETDLPQGGVYYEKRNSGLEENYASDVKFGSGAAGANVDMQLQVVVLREEEQQVEKEGEESAEADIALSVQGSVKSNVAQEEESNEDEVVLLEEVIDSNSDSGGSVIPNGESSPGNIVKGSEPNGDIASSVEETTSSHVITETQPHSDNITMVVEHIDSDTSKADELEAGSVAPVEEEKTADSDVVTEGNIAKESEPVAGSIIVVEEEAVTYSAEESKSKTDSVNLLEEPTDSNAVKEIEHVVDSIAFVEEVAFTNDLKVNESETDGVGTVEESRADDVVKENEHTAYSIVVVREEDSSNIAKESEPVTESTVSVEVESASHAAKESLPKTDSVIAMEETTSSGIAEESEPVTESKVSVEGEYASHAAKESLPKTDSVIAMEETTSSGIVEESELEPDDIAIVDESSVSSVAKGNPPQADSTPIIEELIVNDTAKGDESNTDNIGIVEDSIVNSPFKEDELNEDEVATVEEAAPAKTIAEDNFLPESNALGERKHFLVDFQERVNQYDEAIDEIILRSLNRENYNYFKMLDEYAMKTKMSGEMYTGMRYIIKVIMGTTVVTPSYNEKKKSFKYEIQESTFKRHFITSLFRWYKNFKLVESHFDKANYVYYLGQDDERVYSYRYTYRLILNLLSSETFSFYIDLNKFSLLDILDNYNKYNFKLNNSTRYYPFHMYSCKSFNDFLVDYFESYNHRYFEKHKYLIAEEVYKNGIKNNGNKLFTKLKKLNPNFVLYPFRKVFASSSSPALVENYLDAEIDLIFSIFKEFFVNLLNDLYNEYYNDEVKRSMKEGSHVELSSGIREPSVNLPSGEDELKEIKEEKKTEKTEITPSLDASSAESMGPQGVDSGAASEVTPSEDTLTKVQGEEPTADKLHGSEPTIGQRDDPLDNEIWKDLLESYRDPPKAEDLKEYNQYILKNLNQILNHSAQKRRQEMEDYKNKYELKDGFIVNVLTARHTPLLFNPSKDIYLYLNQISSKKQVNFKNIYDNLITIIKYKEGSNFYDNFLQSRRVAGGLWRDLDTPSEEVNRGASRSGKPVIDRVVVDEDLSSGMNSNELNAFLLFIERGEEAQGGQGTTDDSTIGGTPTTRRDVHSFYRNIDLSEFTPAAVTTKDQIHDQLKLLKKKYTEKLKNEATCVLAFLYLIGINNNEGKLQLPYGFPRNIDYSVKLIRKGKDGLCNFLSGILYHLNLPIFVNNSSISITTEMSEDLIDTNDNSLNSFFYIYYRNNGKIRNHDFLSNENRIIPNSVDNMKSKIVSYSLGSTKDDFYSKLAFTNNMIRLKYKNKDSNIYLRDYFDFTFDKKIYKNSVIKNNISPFLSSCDYLLSNLLGAVVDSLKNTSAIESGIYEENISERNRHLIHNTVDYNKSLFEYFLKLADSRNSYALAALGEIYYLGNESIGIERDEVKAFEFWKKAADQGDSTSALSTGYAYLDEYKKHLRKEEIIKTMSKEELLNMIKEEKGTDAAEETKKDNAGKKASGTYFAFASGGTAAAGMHTSVNHPSSGQGNGRSSAAEGDSPVGGPNFMGSPSAPAGFSSTLYGGGSSESTAQFTPNASRSYGEGQAGIPFGGTEQKQDNSDNRGNTSRSQSDDIIKKYMEELSEERNKALKNAEQYFHKAIRTSEESVEHILAKYNIYKFGLGTEKNLELAGEYLKKAADKGDNISQMMLGHYYSGTDIGVKIKDYDEKNKNENLKKSYKYYSMSAKNGNIISLYNKSILILKGVNPNLKTFNEKCEKTLKKFHFIGLFNERLYVLTKLLRRNYDFKDYTGSLLVSVILSELGDHPNNVNASMLWDLKRKTMQTFTEKYNLVEGILADLLQKAMKEGRATDTFMKGGTANRVGTSVDRIIHRLYNKEKGGKYSLQMKSKLSGDSILKNCGMVTSNMFSRRSLFSKMKFCYYLRNELLHRRWRTKKGGKSNETNKTGRRSSARKTHQKVYNYDVYQLSQTHKQIELFEKYDQIVKSEMEKGSTSREKIQKAEKIKGAILEHFRTSEFLHCYYKPISYYQIKLEEEKKQSVRRNAEQGMSNFLGKSSSYLGYTPTKEKKQQETDLFEAEFSRYSPLLEGEDMKEIFYYQKTYSSSMFEEIQSFSKNCEVCKQYYDIYSAYYGYKKSTIDLIRKYRDGDEYTIKSKRKELQFLIRNSDEDDHEPLYYKALFLESNKLESLKNILQIYLKLATDNHNACNVIGVLGIFKILFKKVFFDVSFFFRKKKENLISAITGRIDGSNHEQRDEHGERDLLEKLEQREKFDRHGKPDKYEQHDQRNQRGNDTPAPATNSLQKYIFADLNSCDVQNNFLFKSEFKNKCLNFEHFVSTNHGYSQISYRDFFKLFYTVVASFFKVS
ncbi:conserved Plasmodium protein, unknown function [Plasmodium knowlesi strain H]|uniref:Sel1 repeat-containing protein n=3 Tax=Plasmodium knowlesi TaxID=5850 RepID=A0A5K1TZX3_PLAKH|nr:Sel1 repeat-containing protein, putative [Plasmodium knowlesi strain H]OTN66657.1 Uncharacterized protein PKNOH_S08492100 [Plasmodium knowlesi]CAA9986809.1 Sel1 repeat-containing protein, putative [Plasmodium knowlesi strain H]SBO23657.1 conserved Plasmodium protein, unknown function [Plasmodium knowlesi strain H]SBO25227.1 conserved Plasmodium protein, unknown function [Plasmodium knowlesi strain H]VVS76283.1 Sel1 repeat-containing protein, putative [Plasmodium knowlesi strain H]|eukprot:XP_002257994.1 hypothetical protein, conserved in Plasmodium species [Plasmodium knowlesi strain H]